MEIPYTVEARPDTGLSNGKFGVWLFLASEVMLFAALFSSYILLRVGSVEWPHGYRRAQRAHGVLQYRRPHHVVGDDGHGVGVVEDERLRQVPAVPRADDPAVVRLPRREVFRVLAPPSRGRRPVAQHVLRDLLHDHRSPRPAHHRRHHREHAICGVRARRCGRRRRSGLPTASRSPGSTGTSSTLCGFFCSRFCICCSRPEGRHYKALRTRYCSRSARLQASLLED